MNHGEDRLAALFWAVRRGEWPSDPSITAWAEPMPVPYHAGPEAYASTAPIMWLHEHPSCQIVLHNEYGDTRIIGETVAGSLVQALPGRA
jgi:hypothetical protein